MPEPFIWDNLIEIPLSVYFIIILRIKPGIENPDVKIVLKWSLMKVETYLILLDRPLSPLKIGC